MKVGQFQLPLLMEKGRKFMKNLEQLKNQNQIAMNFVDSNGRYTEDLSLNPNGSPEGITGLTAANGRITIMMPHPERVFRKYQMSWHHITGMSIHPGCKSSLMLKNF